MSKNVESQKQAKNLLEVAKDHREGKARAASHKPHVKIVYLKKKSNVSKAARQAAFRQQCVGKSMQEVMAAARLIPDVSQSAFKVIRVTG